MDDRTHNLSEKGFSKADSHLSDVTGKDLARILSASCDVALIVARDGLIKDTSFLSDELFFEGGRSWAGLNFLEIVTEESEAKVRQLLKEASSGKTTKSREINHAMIDGDDAPVSYRATKLNDDGDIVVFGHNISRVASLQRRLMSSQLSMEREVARLRGAESRYRAIFQFSEQPNIVVDPSNLRILDINPSAVRILGKGPQRLDNMKVLSLFEGSDANVIHKLMLAAIDERADGDVNIEMSGGEHLTIAARLFRQERRSYLLLTLSSDSGNVVSFANTSERKVLALVEQMPDAFVLTNSSRHIMTANNSFLELFNFAGIRDVEGMLLDGLFERPNVDCNVLLSNVREHGVVRRFATVMRGQYGQTENVEIAAVQLDSHDQAILGFAIRPTSNVIMGSEVEQERVSRSNEQIANLVGHMPLKDIVRETTEMIERLCIETALELTQNNRASAAQMLGVSRQSLYSKLGRGKSENPGEEE